MLTIQQIFDEVDTLIPNPFDNAKKLTWVNELNREFFEVVKIPIVYEFQTVSETSSYDLPADVRSNRISRVQMDSTLYNSMQYEETKPGHNYWSFNDVTKKINLFPKPSISGKTAIVRYQKISSSTYVTATLTSQSPDAPEEYHWAYVLGMCERVAKAMNDVSLANNYGSDYKNLLALAQQNYGSRKEED